MTTAAADLVGRDEELAAIARFLEAGAPACAVAIEGEPGIGKTALWEAALDEAAARGARTLRARPAQSEAKLSFSSLADLLGEALGEVVGELPAPQRRALEIALLIDDSGRADRRAVAAGLLSALRVLAAEAWLVIAIDDMQWLDRASCAALEFAFRRLHAEPVALLAARRPGPGEVAALELTVPPDRLLRLAIGPLEFIELNSVLQKR